MRRGQDILFGVTGQLLVCDAPEGRPSGVASATVYAWNEGDDATAEDAAAAPAVETGPATTLDGAAGVSQTDPTNIPLTATTDIELGREYLITAADGRREWVEVAAITDGESVKARHPLHNDYAAGATFQSTRMTAAVDATWVADENNLDASSGPNPMYRVRWLYTVAGVQHVADTYFSLVRYGGRQHVLPQDVEDMCPGWLDRLPTDHRRDQGKRLIAAAHKAVRLDLHKAGIDDAAVAHAEVVDQLVVLKTIEGGEWARFLSSRDADRGRYDAAREVYRAELDAFARITVKVHVRDTDGAARRVIAQGITRR